ncbi:unnamed protein product [Sphenostylis stenocarpa]|uniref:Uncharacterized protein n=1 Tax=Sphenostylis stenocarpa TaxID=92480 RepID=A0AA86SRT4_9FABA|nr:unnamed protein product [Sphenostylis stenocarpa]
MIVVEEDTKRKINSKDQRHLGQATNPSEDGQAIKECNSWASGARKTMSTQKLSFSANPFFSSKIEKTQYPDLGFQTTIPGYTYRNEWQKDKAKGLALESKGNSESNSIMAWYSFRQLIG